MRECELRNPVIRDEQGKKSIRLTWIAFGALFLALSFFTVQGSGVDDSFITYRYAQNLVQHGVWNWNPTGDYVEAYTNFIYAALAIVPESLGLSSLIFFKIFGCSIILYLCIRLHQLLGPHYAFFVSLAFILANPLFYIHAYSGLETPLYIALLFELVIGLSRDKEEWSEKRLFFLMLLLPLTRPEGALYSIFGFAFFAYEKRRVESKFTLAAIGLLSIIYFSLRYAHFGQLLPNTFYVKSGVPFSARRILDYVFSSFALWGVPFLIFFVRNTGFRILLICSLLINGLYAYSDLQMNFADRFPFQSLAPFYLAAIVITGKKQRDLYNLTMLLMFLIGTVWGTTNFSQIATYYPRLQSVYGSLGVALSKYKDDKLTLMAGDVGLIPYYSGWTTFDFIGLTNKRVSRKGMTVELAEEINPDLILIYSNVGAEPQTGFDYVRNQLPVKAYLNGSEKYGYVGAVELNESFYLLAYLKKTVGKFDEIKASINNVALHSHNFKIDRKKYIEFFYLRRPD